MSPCERCNETRLTHRQCSDSTGLHRTPATVLQLQRVQKRQYFLIRSAAQEHGDKQEESLRKIMC